MKREEVVGIVGESGCGKSITVRSILRLIGRPDESSGSAIFAPADISNFGPPWRQFHEIDSRLIVKTNCL